MDESIDHDLTDDVRARIKSELEPGERLLWAARPIAREESLSRGFLVWSLIAAVLAIIGGVSLGWAFLSTDRSGEGFLSLGLFLGAFDILVIFTLVSVRRQKRSGSITRSRMIYALTDRRAILWSPEPAPNLGAFKVVTIPRGGFSAVHRIEFDDGSGDIVFRERVMGMDYEVFPPLGFFGVAEVRRVEEQIRRTLIVQDAKLPGPFPASERI